MASANLEQIKIIKEKIDECDKHITALRHHIAKEKAENHPDQQRINLLERKICHYELQKSIEQQKLDQINRL